MPTGTQELHRQIIRYELQTYMCISGLRDNMLSMPHLSRDSSSGPGVLQAPAGSCGVGFSGMLAKLRTTPGSSGNAKESGPEQLCCRVCASLQNSKMRHAYQAALPCSARD